MRHEVVYISVAPDTTATPTETPAAPPIATAVGLSTADLEATIEAGLPPTSTPDADGFSMGGFDDVTVLPLTSSLGAPYWTVFTNDFRSFDPLTNHFVAIYTQADGRWQEVSRLELENPDYLDPAAVNQVQIEPDGIWLEVMGGAAKVLVPENVTFPGISYETTETFR